MKYFMIATLILVAACKPGEGNVNSGDNDSGLDSDDSSDNSIDTDVQQDTGGSEEEQDSDVPTDTGDNVEDDTDTGEPYEPEQDAGTNGDTDADTDVDTGPEFESCDQSEYLHKKCINDKEAMTCMKKLGEYYWLPGSTCPDGSKCTENPIINSAECIWDKICIPGERKCFGDGLYECWEDAGPNKWKIILNCPHGCGVVDGSSTCLPEEVDTDTEDPHMDVDYWMDDAGHLWAYAILDNIIWSEANDYCNNLVIGKQTSWALPPILYMQMFVEDCPTMMPSSGCVFNPNHVNYVIGEPFPGCSFCYDNTSEFYIPEIEGTSTSYSYWSSSIVTYAAPGELPQPYVHSIELNGRATTGVNRTNSTSIKHTAMCMQPTYKP